MEQDESIAQMRAKREETAKEISVLVSYFGTLRKEVAKLYLRQDGDVQFSDLAAQLEAIVSSTEEATHSILRALEAINETAFSMEQRLAENKPVTDQCIESIRTHAVKGIEACVFQDVTGQRINKIMLSLRYAEQTIERLVDHAGRDKVAELVKNMRKESKHESDDRRFNQSDIDNLFS